MTLSMTIAYQEWPYRQTFEIARDIRRSALLFLCHVSDGDQVGRGECGLQSLKNETPEIVRAQLESISSQLSNIGSRKELNLHVPAGTARNAVDCALWDLECKRTGMNVWGLSGVARPDKLEVDITVGINVADKMRSAAEEAVRSGYRTIKLKANAEDVLPKITTIAKSLTGVQFIVDANESWSINQLKDLAPQLKQLGVVLIEQPLHHDRDFELEGYDSPIKICADESCATREGIEALAKRYHAVNIKLDKSGGLTEALELARAARALGMGLMMGCNGATSLGNAPAYVVGSLCDWRDIDSHELLFEDREGGMVTENGELHAFDSTFWG